MDLEKASGKAVALQRILGVWPGFVDGVEVGSEQRVNSIQHIHCIQCARARQILSLHLWSSGLSVALRWNL